MNYKTVPLIILLAAGACVPGSSAADQKQPEAAKYEAVSVADFNAEMAKISKANRRKPMNELKAYREYLKNTGLSDAQRLTLHQRIIPLAKAASHDEYKKAMSDLATIPASPQKTVVMVNIIKELAKTDFSEAEKLLAVDPEQFNASNLIQIHENMAASALWNIDDPKKFISHFKALKEMADAEAKTDQQKNAFTSQKNRSQTALLGEYAKYDFTAAKKLFDDNKSLLDEQQTYAVNRAFAVAAIANRDRKAFDAEVKFLLAMPFSAAKINAIRETAEALGKLDDPAAEMLLRDELRNPKLDDKQRFELVLGIRSLNNVNAFDYGFPKQEGYAKYKALTEEMLVILAKGTVKPDGNIANFYFHTARTAYDFGDFKFSEEMLSKALDIQPANYTFITLSVQSALRKNDKAAVEATLKKIIDNPKENEANRTFSEAILFFDSGKPISEFDKAFAEKKYSPEQKMLLLRKVSELMFKAGRYEVVRAISTEIKNNMFAPVEKKSYDVKYVKNAPKTADSWARSEHYGNWNAMETRFEAYGNGYDMSNDVDVKRHLKGAVQPVLDEANKTGVHVICDDEGVHIYVRCNDPAIQEVILGKRDAGSLEMYLKPGEDAAYHSWYFGALPDVNEPHLVNWATPTKNYRMTYDFFTKDAVTTPDGVVAHTYIPWMMFYDKLPVGGNVWKFGMQRWGKDARTLSGNVHDLEQMLELKFAFTPAQMTALKRNVAISAFNRYNKIRQNKGGFIQTWNDSVLGDQAFYKSELEGMIAELDEAGVKLMSPAPDSEINGIFEKYVPLWGEISYVIADKRKSYLKKQLLNQPSK